MCGFRWRVDCLAVHMYKKKHHPVFIADMEIHTIACSDSFVCHTAAVRKTRKTLIVVNLLCTYKKYRTRTSPINLFISIPLRPSPDLSLGGHYLSFPARRYEANCLGLFFIFQPPLENERPST